MRTNENIMIIDTETANTTENPLVYDIGYIIADRHGNIKVSEKYCIYDIFVGMADIMKSAYYSNKLPIYQEEINKNILPLRRLLTVKNRITDLIKTYRVKKVFAYNMYFDKSALNITIRYITKSFIRWFFPYGIEFNCIWNFACNTICNTKGYKDFCETHGYISNRGHNYKSNAEIVYRFISKDTNFTEEHRGLDDVMIEYQILLECYRKHKKVTTDINRLCWRNVKRNAVK